MIRIPINIRELLLHNLRARARMGLSAIPQDEQQRLQAWLKPTPLAISMDEPVYGPTELLLRNMLAVLGLSLEQASQTGPAQARLHFASHEPADRGQTWCWHPQVILQKPALKKQAYQLLKKIKAGLKN